MKKFLYVILTALAALPFVACQEQEEVYKPEVKDITVASVKNLVFLPAGGTGTITVDCATSFTATSDKNWCTVSVSGNDVTVTASANPSNESRYATVLMQTSQSSQKVVVQQVGMVLDGLQLHDERVMVEGAIEHLESHYAVAVTGYAGPGGGPEAPVGTIFVAVGTTDKIEVRELRGDDGREENVARATLTALQMLLERLKNDFPLVLE